MVSKGCRIKVLFLHLPRRLLSFLMLRLSSWQMQSRLVGKCSWTCMIAQLTIPAWNRLCVIDIVRMCVCDESLDYDVVKTQQKTQAALALSLARTNPPPPSSSQSSSSSPSSPSPSPSGADIAWNTSILNAFENPRVVRSASAKAAHRFEIVR